MSDYSTEPHTHTATFTDNDGQSFSAELSCPSSFAEFVARLRQTGAETVNDLAIDGTPMPFEGVFVRLGEGGGLPMLGRSYMTEENLMRLLVSMGAPDKEEEPTT